VLSQIAAFCALASVQSTLPATRSPGERGRASLVTWSHVGDPPKQSYAAAMILRRPPALVKEKLQ